MSTFSVTRAANGQTVVSLQNVENYSVAGLGVMTGNAQFSLGHTTGSSSESVLQLGQTSDAGCLKFEADDTKNSFEFYGKNINAEFNKKSTTPYNVSWNANNSTLDSTKSNSSILFESGENSHDNLIKVGTSQGKVLNKFDNLIIDNGNNNTYIASETSTTKVETGQNSDGAVVKAGNGLNEFYIGGSTGVFVGGNSTDKYVTDQDTANKNLMIGKAGNDSLTDYGEDSLFVGGTGYDSAILSGDNAIANLGFNEAGYFNWEHGSNSAVFTGQKQVDSNGKVYDYNEMLKLRGWSAADFLETSNIDNNPYYSLIKSEIEETLG